MSPIFGRNFWNITYFFEYLIKFIDSPIRCTYLILLKIQRLFSEASQIHSWKFKPRIGIFFLAHHQGHRFPASPAMEMWSTLQFLRGPAGWLWLSNRGHLGLWWTVLNSAHLAGCKFISWVWDAADLREGQGVLCCVTKTVSFSLGKLEAEWICIGCKEARTTSKGVTWILFTQGKTEEVLWKWEETAPSIGFHINL